MQKEVSLNLKFEGEFRIDKTENIKEFKPWCYLVSNGFKAAATDQFSETISVQEDGMTFQFKTKLHVRYSAGDCVSDYLYEWQPLDTSESPEVMIEQPLLLWFTHH